MRSDNNLEALKHQLNSAWRVWHIKPSPPHRNLSALEYGSLLSCGLQFESVEEFFQLILAENENEDLWRGGSHHLGVFREGFQPVWESLPRGGRQIIKAPSEHPDIRKCWEGILLLLIGESFGSTAIIGALLKYKSPKEINISIWFSDASDIQLRLSVRQMCRRALCAIPLSDYSIQFLSFEQRNKRVKRDQSHRRRHFAVAEKIAS